LKKKNKIQYVAFKCLGKQKKRPKTKMEKKTNKKKKKKKKKKIKKLLIAEWPTLMCADDSLCFVQG